ncbi:hypothetical protein H1R20_g131, partial [Candolleomyces eurysporus]
MAKPGSSKKPAGKNVDTAEDSSSPLPTTFKVVAGSYEKLLYGLNGSTTVNDKGELEYHLKPIFIFPAHVSCIKAVSASQGGKWLATGSADEIIKIWDLRRKKEVGGLMHHEGRFPSKSYLLSASEDGTLCLFRARDWAVLRALKGHKGRVNSVAVHPSGKVALSVGKDRTLRMWDLMRGKGSASTKLGKEGEVCRWSVDGSLFAVQSGSSIDIYSTDMQLLHIINHTSRLHDIQFCKRVNGEGEVLFAAAEDKKLSIYAIHQDRSKEPTLFAQMVGHENRVKAMQTLRIALPTQSGRPSTTIVATASSDGKIRIFDMNDIPSGISATSSQEPVQISAATEYDSDKTRFTCITLADGDSEIISSTNAKRKREDDDDEEDEEDAPSDEEAESDGTDEAVEGDEEDEGFGSGWEDEDEMEHEVSGEEEDDPST